MTSILLAVVCGSASFAKDAERVLSESGVRGGVVVRIGCDRCYRNPITERFYINSKTGGADFLDLKTKREFPNHGFPLTSNRTDSGLLDGFKGDLMVTDGEQLFPRHEAFKSDLGTASESRPHLIPSAGFLDGTPQHRTY